jgi:hypothetical protein
VCEAAPEFHGFRPDPGVADQHGAYLLAKSSATSRGRYVVADALDPVHIDREQDRGTYQETNLWMQHL